MAERTNLIAGVDRLQHARILCVGDVMLDHYVYGQVERVSPEAPIPILRVERETRTPGGAGNVLRNLQALGAQSCFVSVIGNDAAGQELNRLIAEPGNVESHILVEAGRVTTMKTRYIAANQQMLRADRESIAPLGPYVRADFLRLVDQAIGEHEVVVISDYAKGTMDQGIAAAVIATARTAGKTVVVDPKGVDYDCYRGASVLKPKVHSLPAAAREVYDVSGAGDTVIATLAAGLAGGLSLIEAARLANLAAGIVVSKIGTAVTYASELREALAGAEHGHEKIRALPRALEQVERWRSHGFRIGFTNGCFDLLHPGHVALLAQARAACDRLVVGLNSDASVARLKGANRPVQPETARAAVLASLASVDLVVSFAEDTPLTVIEAIRPDVLVKGADYRIEEVVGADLVQSYGGAIVLADLIAGHSTTATIRKIGTK